MNNNPKMRFFKLFIDTKLSDLDEDWWKKITEYYGNYDYFIQHKK